MFDHVASLSNAKLDQASREFWEGKSPLSNINPSRPVDSSLPKLPWNLCGGERSSIKMFDNLL